MEKIIIPIELQISIKLDIEPNDPAVFKFHPKAPVDTSGTTSPPLLPAAPVNPSVSSNLSIERVCSECTNFVPKGRWFSKTELLCRSCYKKAHPRISTGPRKYKQQMEVTPAGKAALGEDDDEPEEPYVTDEDGDASVVARTKNPIGGTTLYCQYGSEEITTDYFEVWIDGEKFISCPRCREIRPWVKVGAGG